MAHAPQTNDVTTLTLPIAGMHCVNCEVRVERRLRALDGVSGVRVSHRSGSAELRHSGALDLDAVQAALAEDGYALAPRPSPGKAAAGSSGNSPRDYAEIAAVFAILIGAYLALKRFDLVPRQFTVLDQMSYGFVFVIGLVASVSSCIAVTGGLLVAIAAKYNETAAFGSGWEKLKPHLYFNVGRILSYTLLGGLVGALGSALTLSPAVNGALTIAASAIMILLGLHMLKFFALGRLLPTMPKFLAHRIHDLAVRDAKGGAFLFGASTFFLPCGFTQALQLYVLAKGGFALGALTMLAFALGTLPALLSLSALSSFASGAFQKHFLRIAGAVVVMLGLMNIQYGLVLAKSDFASAPVALAAAPAVAALPPPAAAPPAVAPDALPERGYSTRAGQTQIVEMAVIDFEYEPHQFKVKQGVPVEWRIDGREAAGCGRLLMAPKLGIRKILSQDGPTVITFTPKTAGEFAFNCGMGMMTPDSKFTVVPNG